MTTQTPALPTTESPAPVPCNPWLEDAAALVREIMAARREVEIRRLSYVPSADATMQG